MVAKSVAPPEWPADRVERRPIAGLIPYARNARTHSEAQVAQIAASIREWGWTVPVLCDEAGGIIAGHGRVLAARLLGLEAVPVMVASGWSDAQRRAYVLADNKLALNGEWDTEALRIELGELWGRVTASHDAVQRQDDLFFEYARLLQGLQPRAFVAENVSGLVKGTAKGYFIEILRTLRNCGYRVGAQLLDAQWLGVPQARERLIFVGIREDLDAAPPFPAPLAWRYSVRDALPWARRHGTSPAYDKFKAMNRDPFRTLVDSASRPTGTIVTTQTTGIGHIEAETPEGLVRRRVTIGELKRLCGFPDDYVLAGPDEEQWARCGNAVPPVMMAHVARALLPVLAPGSQTVRATVAA